MINQDNNNPKIFDYFVDADIEGLHLPVDFHLFTARDTHVSDEFNIAKSVIGNAAADDQQVNVCTFYKRISKCF
jgi:hypothetical protein